MLQERVHIHDWPISRENHNKQVEIQKTGSTSKGLNNRDNDNLALYKCNKLATYQWLAWNCNHSWCLPYVLFHGGKKRLWRLKRSATKKKKRGPEQGELVNPKQKSNSIKCTSLKTGN